MTKSHEDEIRIPEKAFKAALANARRDLGEGATFEDVLRGAEYEAKKAGRLKEGESYSDNVDHLNLRKVDFSGMDLSGVVFDNCNLQEVNFRRANIRDASFFGADVTDARFEGTEGIDDTYGLTEGYQSEKGTFYPQATGYVDPYAKNFPVESHVDPHEFSQVMDQVKAGSPRGKRLAERRQRPSAMEVAARLSASSDASSDMEGSSRTASDRENIALSSSEITPLRTDEASPRGTLGQENISLRKQAMLKSASAYTISEPQPLVVRRGSDDDMPLDLVKAARGVDLTYQREVGAINQKGFAEKILGEGKERKIDLVSQEDRPDTHASKVEKDRERQADPKGKGRE